MSYYINEDAIEALRPLFAKYGELDLSRAVQELGRGCRLHPFCDDHCDTSMTQV